MNMTPGPIRTAHFTVSSEGWTPISAQGSAHGPLGPIARVTSDEPSHRRQGFTSDAAFVIGLSRLMVVGSSAVRDLTRTSRVGVDGILNPLNVVTQIYFPLLTPEIFRGRGPRLARSSVSSLMYRIGYRHECGS